MQDLDDGMKDGKPDPNRKVKEVQRLFYVNPDEMYFEYKHKACQYHPLLITMDFDPDKELDDQESEWVTYAREEDFYNAIAEYYKENKDLGIKLYNKGEIESECEDEE